MKVPVTVVVPARGNEGQLRLSLDALRDAEPGADQIIVVDDESPRSLEPIVAEYGFEFLRRTVRGGPGAGRNDGVATARNDVVLFIDSDVVIHRDTIGRVAARFAQPDAPDALFGSYDEEPHARTFTAQYKNLVHHFIHQGARRRAMTFWAGCGAVRKSSFLSVGGFDTRRFDVPSVEDIDLGYRMTDRDMVIELDPSLQVCHLKAWTLVEMIRVDVFKRAVPWTRLMLERGSVPPDLNLRPHHRISAGLVGLLVAATACLAITCALGWAWPAGSGGLVLATLVVLLLALNADLYTFFLKRRGLWFMLRAIPVHWLYYFYSAATFVIVRVQFALTASRRSSG